MRNNNTHIVIQINKKLFYNLALILGFFILFLSVFALENLRYKQSAIVIIMADFIFFAYIQYIILRWMKNITKFNKIRYLVPLVMSVVLTLYSLFRNFSAIDPALFDLGYDKIFLWSSCHFLVGLVFTVVFILIKNFSRK